MSDVGESKRIGAGSFSGHEPSREWFPRMVTPEKFLIYWNDVDGKYRRELARHWLTTGFDSTWLRWLATLDDGAVERVTTAQIFAVLASLNVQVELPEDFISRCARAISRVQVDLDATGFEQFRMRPVNASAGDDCLPAVYAALQDGNWAPSGFVMQQPSEDEELVLIAAESVTCTLMELERVSWPTCFLHAGQPMTLVAAKATGPVWRCESGNHDAARLSELTRDDVVR